MAMRIRYHASVLLVLIAVATVELRVYGQIVNVLDAVESSKEGFNGAIESSMEWRTGNTNILRFGGKASASYRLGRHLVFIQMNTDRGEQRTVKDSKLEPYIRNRFAHMRYRALLKGPLMSETFIQYAADEIQRLRLRALAGAGLRLQSSRDAAWGYVAAGTDYMLSWEDYDSNACPEDNYSHLQHRWSNYLQFAIKLHENLSLLQTTFAQPLLTDFTNLRILSEGALVIKAGRFFMKSSVTISHDSNLASRCEDADPKLENLDTTMKSAIGFSF